MPTKEAHENYEAFVAKFEPKRTTDDCFTPPLVYEALKEWTVQAYCIPTAKRVLRPFWPGKDYTAEDYTGAVVIDNPPFSFLASIVDFFRARAIPFLLFAPALTAMSYARRPDVSVLYIGAQITYENGAAINTAFLTNMEPETTARSCPDLDARISAAMEATRQARGVTQPPVYVYPPNVIIGSHLATLARFGISFRLTRANSVRIPHLASQKAEGKAIFGSGLLLSTEKAREATEKAQEAARRAQYEAEQAKAASLASATVWPLSDEERRIIQTLDNSPAQE